MLLRLGDVGPAVAEVRTLLHGLGLLPPASGRDAGSGDVFDAECQRAVRAFQQDRGLLMDGIVGSQTLRTLRGSRFRLGDRELRFVPSGMLYGDDVSSLQERLLELGFDAGRQDGIHGPSTDAALRSFQRDYGIPADGVCGPATLRSLRQLGRLVVGGRPHMLREIEALHRRGPSLTGKRIMIDPGHGGDDHGVVAGRARETDLVWDIALRLQAVLTDLGAQALLSRSAEDNPDEGMRAATANAAGVDLVISLHMDSNPVRAAHGIAAFHFGTESGASRTIGERLAQLACREIGARTGFLDLGAHARTWDLLRLTTMPAVRLEIGYLSNPEDAAALSSERVRELVAESIVVAAQRLYLPQERDHKTGTMDVAELRRHL